MFSRQCQKRDEERKRQADGKREGKEEMMMEAAWGGQALQVLNMDLWWASITY